jgi:cytoskeletal protein CcmA (bactofilin family)
MEKIPGARKYLKIPFFLIFSLSLQTLSAQQKTLSEYVLFAGFGQQSTGVKFTVPSSPGQGIILGSGANISGDIGSHNLLQTTGSAIFKGNLNSGGTLILSNNNSITGNLTVGNSKRSNGDILFAGSNTSITGNIDANGNVKISSGLFNGQLSQPAGSSYSGPEPTSRSTQLNIPVLPGLPVITSFTAGNNNISNSRSIDSGKYGNLSLGGGRIVTFSTTGDYYFKSIRNSGTFNKFVFDFTKDPKGIIRIFVEGDANLNKMNVDIINGSPSQIYLETHGNGSANAGFAFNLSPGSSGGGRFSEWYGTVFAPYAAIKVGSGSEIAKVKGALYSGTQIVINNGRIRM